VSLLLAQGHTAARRYPVGMVWSEVRFVRERVIEQHRTEAVLMSAVVANAIGGKNVLKKALEALDNG
jgi:hypothetical protein